MHQHGFLLWGVFAACGLFAIVYKAVMSSGSELTPFATTRSYFAQHSITITMRFLIAQFGYFLIIGNPALIGDIFLGAEMFSTVKAAPVVLAGLLGLASDKVADILIVIGQWVYRKVTKVFANGNGA